MDDRTVQPPSGPPRSRRLSRRVFVKGALSLPPALALASMGAASGAAATPTDPLHNFVLGELCVVVSGAIVDPKALYGNVRTWLNGRISSLVRAASPINVSDPVDRELNPGSLRPYLPQPDNGIGVVSWLVAQPSGALDPWVVLEPPVQGTARQALLFYNVGVGKLGDDLEAIVRRLVNAINLTQRQTGGAKGSEFHVDAATPNWYTVVCPHTCGGPGGKTEPAPARPWQISFGSPALEAARASAAQKAVAKGRSDVV